MARDTYEVVPHRMAFGLLGWRATVRYKDHRNGDEVAVIGVYANKTKAVSEVSREAKFWLRMDPERYKSEIIIKNKWGRIHRKDTYGYDPVKSKG